MPPSSPRRFIRRELTIHAGSHTHELHHVAQARGGPQVGYRHQRYQFRGGNSSGSSIGGRRPVRRSGRVDIAFGSADATPQPSQRVSVVPRLMWERF
jgi:hypothetical protein